MSRTIPFTIHPEFDQEASHRHVVQEEGQLSVDVVSSDDEVCVVAPMAGVDTDTIDVHIHNDVLTIRGERPNPMKVSGEHMQYHTECFWGLFSRTIVLPVPVIAERAAAKYISGVLHVRAPKQSRDKHIPITIVEE